VHHARERLQLVSGEHLPPDEELHAEHEALAPLAAAIEQAIATIATHEASLAERGLLPWYQRGLGGGSSYWRPKQGPGELRHSPGGAHVPGDEDTGMATRADKVWFDRGGCDPIVALLIMKAIMQSVRPPAVQKQRGQYADEQINRVLELMKDKSVDLPTLQISELLIAIGYQPEKVSVPRLTARLAALRDSKQLNQVVRKTKSGKTMGRPRSK
jgi:hypothetical protein